jgi:hypothetical protein
VLSVCSSAESQVIEAISKGQPSAENDEPGSKPPLKVGRG